MTGTKRIEDLEKTNKICWGQTVTLPSPETSELYLQTSMTFYAKHWLLWCPTPVANSYLLNRPLSACLPTACELDCLISPYCFTSSLESQMTGIWNETLTAASAVPAILVEDLADECPAHRFLESHAFFPSLGLSNNTIIRAAKSIAKAGTDGTVAGESLSGIILEHPLETSGLPLQRPNKGDWLEQSYQS